MKPKNYTGLVPENKEGKSITAEACVTLESEEKAQAFYALAKGRLLDVNNWGKMAGALSADFALTDSNGKAVGRSVSKNDHFRIDIPGPGSKAGKGYDWARVEDVKEVHQNNVDSVAIRVRPAANPQSDNQAVAHFYAQKSTSTFVVTREGSTVTASVYDRNIEANEETEELQDKVRNAAIGLGAKHGVSKLQWQAFAKALVDTEGFGDAADS